VEYGRPISGIEKEALVIGGDSGYDDKFPLAIGSGTYKVKVKNTP
jgi:hypothetical protein